MGRMFNVDVWQSKIATDRGGWAQAGLRGRHDLPYRLSSPAAWGMTVAPKLLRKPLICASIVLCAGGGFRSGRTGMFAN